MENKKLKEHGFWRSLISDETGSVSSKRFIAIFCVVIVAVLIFLEIFLPEAKKPSSVLIDAINYIGMAAIGASSADKFSNREKSTNENV